MNRLRHTPGPWEVNGSRVTTVGTDAERKTLATTQPRSGFTMDAEQQANATLMAYSPDMYAALRRVKYYLEGEEYLDAKVLLNALLSTIES